MNLQFRPGKGILRPLPWILAYGTILAWGLLSLWRIPMEVLPRFNYPQVSIISHLPGATAAELESQIASPIEDQLLALPNVLNVRSVMGNGTVETDIRFQEGTDAQQDLLVVNGAVDRARSQVPASVQPQAEVMGNAINEVADYTVQIPADIPPARVQTAVLASVVPALRAIPGVQKVELFGTGPEALWIQPDLHALEHAGIPVTTLCQAVQDQVLLSPAGYVTQGHQDLMIEARNLPAHVAQWEQIPVPGPQGPVPLHDLARVVREAVPAHGSVRLDGRQCIALAVFKQPDASTVPVTRAIKDVLADTVSQLPAGVQWVQVYDQGRLVHVVGVDLGRNLLLGGFLAAAVLFWVLGAGRGIWTLALSIPISLLLAIAALHAAGQSLDLMTLGALTVAVGLLADDAIIVLESIYHCWEQGTPSWLGVWQGLKSIAIPDITGTLTTVAVFVPLLFVGGLVGLFFIPFALAMTFALLASLVVSLTFIPLSLGFTRAVPVSKTTSGGRALHWLAGWNERLFQWVSRRPILSLVLTFVMLALSLVGVALVPVNFLPLPNEGVLLMSFTLPPGSALEDTQAAVRQMTSHLLADPSVAHVFARIGSSDSTTYTEPAYAGELQIVLKSGVSVNSLDAIGNRLLDEARLTGVQDALDTPTIERVGESLSGLPQPFVLQLFGSQIPELGLLGDQIAARLRSIPALSDVFNNDGYPISQLQIIPNSVALADDQISPAQLYAQINPILNGQVLAQVPDSSVPLDVYMRLANAPGLSLPELAQLPIHDTGWTPLGDLADINLVQTPNQIRHLNGARLLEILATPAGPLGSSIAAARHALSDLPLPPGYRIAFGGLFLELEKALLGLLLAGMAALVLMVGILILQFDGFLVPALLLLEIPLALMGGAIALIVTGVGLNATGLIAFLTLIGIGLRHGIVLLDRARQNEAEGMDVEQAVRQAIRVRFRPIVLTAATAILGMLPTALGLGQGAAPEQGLAVVILGGVLWSALRSTNLIPALYLHWRLKQINRK